MLDVCWCGVIAEAIGRGYSQITGFDQSNEAREWFGAGDPSVKVAQRGGRSGLSVAHNRAM